MKCRRATLESAAEIADGSSTRVGEGRLSVFISYSSEDRRAAETICKALEARGHRCWIAFRDVKAGENFQEAIVKALRQAKVMLLVFSSSANNSEEIKKELVLAGRHRVTVIPVRIEDVAPSDAFAYELATRQWIDLFRDWEAEIESLSRQIGDHLDVPPAKANGGRETGAAAPDRKGFSPLVAVGALALVLLAAGAAWFALKPSGIVTRPQAQPGAQAVALVKPPAAPVQTAAVTPAVSSHAPVTPVSVAPATAPSSPKPAHVHPQTAVMAAASPAPAQAAPATPEPPASDDGAWQAASNANTRAAFGDYLKQFPGGQHAQDAQLRIAALILAMPATGSAFDGAWQTVWTCPNVGSYLGYSYQFEGRVKDGVYHGVKGESGKPSSMVLDGRIESDGAAAFSGEVIVGSSMTGLGAARGTASDFHAAANFAGASGQGRRLEGRACSLSFTRQ